MKCTTIALLAAITAGAGSGAWADDAPAARPELSPKQMMRECMAKERAANASAPEADVKKTCEAKIKAYREHPSVTTPPASTPPAPG